MENTAKILLLGKTGTGKSSFINYFLGKTVAQAGVGRPVTQDYFIPYEITDGRYPILIYDTKGLEALDANTQLEEIIRGVKERNKSDNIFDWFHTIFYCVSMSDPRFQDFEANFIRRLQSDLSQHIHIILTHCDAASPEQIANMRKRIETSIGNMNGVEIFEVVCIQMEKLNGQIVEPYGKEIISERVFDLLVEDIAYKLSCNYAETLWNALNYMINGMFLELDAFVDETVTLKTLFRFLQDDTSALDYKMDSTLSQIEYNAELIQKQTDEEFANILLPAAQLYASYKGVVTDSDYVADAELAFSDAFEWIDSDWLEAFDDQHLMATVMPRLSKFMDENGELPEDDNTSLFGLLDMVVSGVGDLFHLKKNLKQAFYDLHYVMKYQMIPSQREMQEEAYDRIIQYIEEA